MGGVYLGYVMPDESKRVFAAICKSHEFSPHQEYGRVMALYISALGMVEKKGRVLCTLGKSMEEINPKDERFCVPKLELLLQVELPYEDAPNGLVPGSYGEVDLFFPIADSDKFRTFIESQKISHDEFFKGALGFYAHGRFIEQIGGNVMLQDEAGKVGLLDFGRMQKRMRMM